MKNYRNNPYVRLSTHNMHQFALLSFDVMLFFMQKLIDESYGDVAIGQVKNIDWSVDVTEHVNEFYVHDNRDFEHDDEFTISFSISSAQKAPFFVPKTIRDFRNLSLLLTSGADFSKMEGIEFNFYTFTWNLNGSYTPNQYMIYFNYFAQDAEEQRRKYNWFELHLFELTVHEFTHALDTNLLVLARGDARRILDSRTGELKIDTRIPISNVLKSKGKRHRRYISSDDPRFFEAYVNQRVERKALLNSIFYTLDFIAKYDPSRLEKFDTTNDELLFRRASRFFMNLAIWHKDLDPMSKLKVIRVIRSFQRQNPQYFPNLFLSTRKQNPNSIFPPFNAGEMRHTIESETELGYISDTDLRKFYNFYLSLYKNNQFIQLYRVIGLVPGRKIDMSSLGESWAMQKRAALSFINKMVVYLDDDPEEPVYHDEVEGLQIFLLSGKVHRDNVDWNESLLLGLRYSWQELAYTYPDADVDFILAKMAENTSYSEAEVELVVKDSSSDKFQDLKIELLYTV